MLYDIDAAVADNQFILREIWSEIVGSRFDALGD